METKQINNFQKFGQNQFLLMAAKFFAVFILTFLAIIPVSAEAQNFRSDQLTTNASEEASQSLPQKINQTYTGQDSPVKRSDKCVAVRNAINQKTSEFRIRQQQINLTENIIAYVKLNFWPEAYAGLQCKPENFYLTIGYKPVLSTEPEQFVGEVNPLAVELDSTNSLHYTFVIPGSVIGNVQEQKLSLTAYLVERENGKTLPIVKTGSLPKFAVGDAKSVFIGSSIAAGGAIDDAVTMVGSQAEDGKVLAESSGWNPLNYVVDSLFSFLVKVVANLALIAVNVVVLLFMVICLPVLKLLLNIQPWRDAFVDVIYPGWLIMRNLANIAFIASLLYMGLRLIFQQEDSGATRKFVIKLVLAALLVNFSLVIGQGIVAIADTVQSQFLPANSYVIETLGKKLIFDPLYTLTPGLGGPTDTDYKLADLFRPIVLLILAYAGLAAFVALIMFIFVRLVALWILYLTSPLAYFGMILPQTAKFASQWWDNFIKYTIMVPILAFFLNMAALMAHKFSMTGSDLKTLRSLFPENYSGDAITSPIIGGMQQLTGNLASPIVNFALTTLTFMIPFIFIFLGMKYALSSGTFGASKIVGLAKGGFDKAIDWTKKTPKFLGNTAAGALNTSKWGKPLNWAGDKLGTNSILGNVLNKTGDTLNRVGKLSEPVTSRASKTLTVLSNPKKTGKLAYDKYLKERVDKFKGATDDRIGGIEFLKKNLGRPEDSFIDAGYAARERELSESTEAVLYDFDKAMKKRDWDQINLLTYALLKRGKHDDLVKAVNQYKSTFGLQNDIQENSQGIKAYTEALQKNGATGDIMARDFNMLSERIAGKEDNMSSYLGFATKFKPELAEGRQKGFASEDVKDVNGQFKYVDDKEKEWRDMQAKKLTKKDRRLAGIVKNMKDDQLVEKDENGKLVLTRLAGRMVAKQDTIDMVDNKSNRNFWSSDRVKAAKMSAAARNDHGAVEKGIEEEYRAENKIEAGSALTEMQNEEIKDKALAFQVRMRNASLDREYSENGQLYREYTLNGQKRQVKVSEAVIPKKKKQGGNNVTDAVGGFNLGGSNIDLDEEEGNISMSVPSAINLGNVQSRSNMDFNMGSSSDGGTNLVRGQASSGIGPDNTSSNGGLRQDSKNQIGFIRPNQESSSPQQNSEVVSEAVSQVASEVANQVVSGVQEVSGKQSSGYSSDTPTKQRISVSSSVLGSGGGGNTYGGAQGQNRPMSSAISQNDSKLQERNNAREVIQPTALKTSIVQESGRAANASNFGQNFKPANQVKSSVKPAASKPVEVSSFSPQTLKTPQAVHTEGIEGKITPKGVFGLATDSKGQTILYQDGKTPGNMQVREVNGVTQAVPNYTIANRADDYKNLMNLYNIPQYNPNELNTNSRMKIIVENPAELIKDSSGGFKLANPNKKGIIRLEKID